MLTQRQLESAIVDRAAYLRQIERDIEEVTLAGSDRIRVLQGEIDSLEREKARLMKQLLGLNQQIRERKLVVVQIV